MYCFRSRHCLRLTFKGHLHLLTEVVSSYSGLILKNCAAPGPVVHGTLALSSAGCPQSLVFTRQEHYPWASSSLSSALHNFQMALTYGSTTLPSPRHPCLVSFPLLVSQHLVTLLLSPFLKCITYVLRSVHSPQSAGMD